MTSPKTLLLLPGLLCDERLWSAQIKELSGLVNCRVPNLTSYDSIAAMAKAVLQEAPERFALAGFSMGGLVALEIVAQAPERVERFALLSTNFKGILPAFRQQFQASMTDIGKRGIEAYLHDAFPRYVSAARLDDRTIWEIFSSMGMKVGAAAALRQMQALLDYPPFSHPEKITCPMILLSGSEDRRTPVAAHTELAQQIPGAQLHVIEGSGHFTMLEKPDEVTGALRNWLQS